MNDQIERLNKAAESDLRAALATALDRARTGFDVPTVRAVLENFEPDEPAHGIDQLELALGLAKGTLEPLEAVLSEDTADSPVTLLFGLFAAVAALSAASVGHVLNTGSRRFSEAREGTALDPMRRYSADTAQALREAAQRAFAAPGSEASRARQLSRIIGLSAAQGRSLDRMRQLAFDHLATPAGGDEKVRRARIEAQMASYRGLLSAPQIAMLKKAFVTGITEADAERMLDRHANALRAHRAKVTAGHVAHGVTEGAKLIGWQIAQFFGFLPNTARRHWRTAGDERVRLSHASVPGMNPGGVLLSEPFKTPLGNSFVPPLEINCRCRVSLQVPK